MTTEETKPVEREAFERWARTWFDGEGEDPIFFDPSEECYSRHAVHSSWMAWQASAAATLERAAELCDVSAAAIGQKAVPARHEAAQLAAEIRALKGRE
jgi:hypothetical protein